MLVCSRVSNAQMDFTSAQLRALLFLHSSAQYENSCTQFRLDRSQFTTKTQFVYDGVTLCAELRLCFELLSFRLVGLEQNRERLQLELAEFGGVLPHSLKQKIKYTMLENLVLSWFILLLIVTPVVYPHLVLNYDLAEVSGGISKLPMIPRGNLLSTSG